MPKCRVKHHIHCANCLVNYLCVAKGLSSEEIQLVNNIIHHVKIASKGEHIFYTGDELKSLYAVHTGSFKDYWTDSKGNERINNFYLPGDIIGLEGVAIRQHSYNLVALEDSILCIIPLDPLFQLMHLNTHILKRIFNITSYKMQNDRQVHITTNANQRVVDFLLNMLNRLQERNRHASSVILPISQLDIGGYLGMAHETVNRTLKKLQHEAIIDIQNKKIHILNQERLQHLSSPIPHPTQSS